MALATNDAAVMAAEPSIEEQPTRGEPGIRLWITLEVLIYVILAVLAVVLRLAKLGDSPMDDPQANQALAALREVNPKTPGDDIPADSPITFALDAISFNFIGQGNVAARFPVAIGGALLALSPILWRRYLNPLPPLIVSLILTISPVALLASRTMSPVTWTALLAVVGPWLVLRFFETDRSAYAVLSTVAFGAMIFLAEPAGLLMLVALAFGVVFAWLTEPDPAATTPALRRVWFNWPWGDGALAFGLVALAIGTGLFILPSGLTSIGNLLAEGLRGFWHRTTGAPIAFPLLIVLRYETGLLVFGLIACYRAIREGGFFERVLAGWLLAGVLLSLLYAGSTAGHALWMTVPLAVLVALSVTRWLTDRPDPLWGEVPGWGVPLHGLITAALWAAVILSLVLVGKSLLNELGSITNLGEVIRLLFKDIYSRSAGTAEKPPGIIYIDNMPFYEYTLGFLQLRLVMILLSTMLLAVLFFLVASLWGGRAGWYGFAVGSVAFWLVFSWGLGTREAFTARGDPRMFWFPDPVTDDVHELRVTLDEMSERETGDAKLIDISAMVPQDGAIAWALRDYPNTTFVDGVGAETKTAAVIMPYVYPPVQMGGSYVGKDMVIRESWIHRSPVWKDALMWFYKSESADKPTAREIDMLWIRNDVYGVEQVISQE